MFMQQIHWWKTNFLRREQLLPEGELGSWSFQTKRLERDRFCVEQSDNNVDDDDDDDDDDYD